MQNDEHPRRRRGSSLAYWRDILLIATLSIGGLYAGAGFLIPLVMAFLVFVLITAVSDRVVSVTIGGHQLPPWFGYFVGSVAVLAGLFAIMFVMGNQATSFARAMPRYEAQIDNTLTRIAALIGADVVEFIRTNIIQIDVSRMAISAFGGASSFLNMFLLICLYVAFMIGERAAMNAKMLIAATDETLRKEITSITEAISVSLRRYMGVKTSISALVGLFSYAVFRLLDLEFAETWAVLTFALNFIPSIGSVLAVILPALVALVQFDSVGPFLSIVFGCGIVQFVIGNFLDPAVTGRSLNISTFMVILALTFWTSVWGLLGAFLSVPLTVCILIVFSQIPATRPLAILMSKDGQLNSDLDRETRNGSDETVA